MKIGYIIDSDITYNFSILSEIYFVFDFIKLYYKKDVEQLNLIFIKKRLFEKFMKNISNKKINLYLLENKQDIESSQMLSKNDVYFSNIFSKYPSMDFPGGNIYNSHFLFYFLLSKVSQKKTLFLRQPDNSLHIIDIKYEVDRRFNHKTAYVNFKIKNAELIKEFNNIEYVNYDNCKFLVNGIFQFDEWYYNNFDKFIKSKINNKSEKFVFVPNEIIFQTKKSDEIVDFEFFKYSNNFVHFAYDSKFKQEFLEKNNYISKYTDINLVKTRNKSENKNLDYENFLTYINKFKAYIFIPKVDKISYINKTIYDCNCAKIPVILHESFDEKRRIFNDSINKKYEDLSYYKNEEELNNIFKKLSNKHTRMSLTYFQRNKLDDLSISENSFFKVMYDK